MSSMIPLERFCRTVESVRCHIQETVGTNVTHQCIRDLGVSMSLSKFEDVMRYLGRVA
jgi:hypothetical protein